MDSKALLLGVISLLSFILVGFAIVIKRTNGLFWSRPPQDFIKDSYDPNFENERAVGLKASEAMIKYITPIAIAFLILFILSLLGVL